MKLKDLNIDMNEQGTIEWKRARIGYFTGTRIGDIMSRGRKKDEVFGATAISTIAEVAGERLLDTELVADDALFDEWCQLQFAKSKVMQFGNDNEDYARSMYEIESGNSVEKVGLVFSHEVEWLASSPDGVVLDEGGEIEGIIEIKCPQNKNYMLYCWNITDGKTLKDVNSSYYWQLMTNMLVTGAKWADFIIYSRFHTTGVNVVRIERNEDDIQKIPESVKLANELIDKKNGKKTVFRKAS